MKSENEQFETWHYSCGWSALATIELVIFQNMLVKFIRNVHVKVQT
jgi:hypothetical protein